jgi:uncharacterized membrane protein YqjE
VDSIRNLGEGLLASVQDRIALFSLELDEEKFRLIQVFFWISAIAFAGAMALTFASLALVYLFWESARLAVLGGLALVYATAFVSIVVAFRRFLRRQPMMLAGTLQEIREDRECIRTRN